MLVSTGQRLLALVTVDRADTDILLRWKSRQGSGSGLNTLLTSLAIGAMIIAWKMKGSKDEDKPDSDSDSDRSTQDYKTDEVKATPVSPPSTNNEVKRNRVSRGGKLTNEDVLMYAARKHGVPFKLLHKLVGAESNFRNVKARTSSASGWFQFTEGTWKYLIEKFPEFGYSLEDRMDPRKASDLASVYLKSIIRSLTKYLGRAPSDREIYAAYVLGPTGARRLLKAAAETPNEGAATMFPTAARANKNLFYADGRELTVNQLMSKFESRINQHAAAANAAETAYAVSEPEIQDTVVARSLPDTSSPVVVPVEATLPVVATNIDKPSIPVIVQRPKAPPKPKQYLRDRNERVRVLNG